MAGQNDPILQALVYDYFTRVDKSLSEVWKIKTKAVSTPTPHTLFS